MDFLYINLPKNDPIASKLLLDASEVMHDKKSSISDFKKILNNKDFDFKKYEDELLYIISSTDRDDFLKFLLTKDIKTIPLNHKSLEVASYLGSSKVLKELLKLADKKNENKVYPVLLSHAVSRGNENCIKQILSLCSSSLKDEVLQCFFQSLSYDNLAVSSIFLNYIDLSDAKDKLLNSGFPLAVHSKKWFLNVCNSIETKKLISHHVKQNKNFVKPVKKI